MGPAGPAAQPAGAPAAQPAAQPAAAPPAEGPAPSSSDSDSDSDNDAAAPAAPEPDPESDAEWVKEEEDEQARNHVYVVTYSALLNKPEDADLVNPAEKDDRAFFRQALLDAVANLPPAASAGSRGGRPRTRALEVDFLLTVQEKHQDGKMHYHQAARLSHETRFLPLKAALRGRSKLASHWSTSRAEVWSAVRYLTRATEKKKQVHRSPDPLDKRRQETHSLRNGQRGLGRKSA